jgi:hypothetical protein
VQATRRGRAKRRRGPGHPSHGINTTWAEACRSGRGGPGHPVRPLAAGQPQQQAPAGARASDTHTSSSGPEERARYDVRSVSCGSASTAMRVWRPGVWAPAGLPGPGQPHASAASSHTASSCGARRVSGAHQVEHAHSSRSAARHAPEPRGAPRGALRRTGRAAPFSTSFAGKEKTRFVGVHETWQVCW